MIYDLETAINLWYKEWLKTHDPFEDDFDDEIESHFPHLAFTYVVEDVRYVLL